MNADRLLANFDRIADAPDAVPRLRRFILDLAVRGKLVEQNPNDEPASELLARIQAEKARLVKAESIKNPKKFEAVGSVHAEFCIPSSWCWTRLGEITSYIQRGKSPKYASANGFPVVSQKCVQWHGLNLNAARQITYQSLSTYEDIRFLRDGDLLWNSTGTGTIGRIIRISDPPGRLVCDSHVTVVRCLIVSSEYIRTWLRSGNVHDLIEERAVGSTKQVELTAQMALNQSVPLPPLAEQHRIVAKVDELMAVCARLEAVRAGREATRERLAAASLARLNAPDPDPATFRDHAAFALDNLAPLTTRRYQVKALRHTILDLAVRGKLLEQDPTDKPASELLTRIAADKARLIEAGKIGKEKRLPLISGTQTLFPIPRGWSWCRLGNLSKLVTSGSRGWAKHYSREGAVFLRMGNLSKGHYRLRLDQIQRVKPPPHGEGTRTRLEAGDLLISITGDVGMLGMVTEDLGEAYINQHIAVVRPVNGMKDRYLAELLRSPLAQRQFNEPQRGIKNSFRLTDVTQILVPLPPLAEQYRIVAKVDELMALCDQLEANFDSCENTRRRLLDAFLYEAFEPTTDCMATA